MKESRFTLLKNIYLVYPEHLYPNTDHYIVHRPEASGSSLTKFSDNVD
jgi:hypothetical protein